MKSVLNIGMVLMIRVNFKQINLRREIIKDLNKNKKKKESKQEDDYFNNYFIFNITIK